MLNTTSAWLNTFWLWGQQYLVLYLQNCWPSLRGTQCYSLSSSNSDSSINCTMESSVGKEVEEGSRFQSHSEWESYDKNLPSRAGSFSEGETRWRTAWTDPCAGSRNWVFQSDQPTARLYRAFYDESSGGTLISSVI